MASLAVLLPPRARPAASATARLQPQLHSAAGPGRSGAHDFVLTPTGGRGTKTIGTAGWTDRRWCGTGDYTVGQPHSSRTAVWSPGTVVRGDACRCRIAARSQRPLHVWTTGAGFDEG